MATERAKAKNSNLKPVLPEAERIYYKDFHFLDEPLIDRLNRKEAESEKQREKELSKKAATQGGSAVSTAAGSTLAATKGSIGCAQKLKHGIVKT